MGMFSFIGDIFGDITGANDAADASREASAQNLAFQQQGLDYLKEVQQPVLDIRNQALPALYGFYDPTNPSGQADFVQGVQQSPFYESMIQQGEEAVLRNQAATGGLRSGTTQQNLARNSQGVLQGLVNQQLQGLGSFAQTPINAGQIANQYGQMGQAAAQGALGAAQAQQAGMGQLLGLGEGLLSGAADLGWKPFG